jgi:hypothetical protein
MIKRFFLFLCVGIMIGTLVPKRWFRIFSKERTLRQVIEGARSQKITPRFQSVVPLKNPKYHLVVIAIFRDEARFLREWIEYYRMLGVDHFYLGNHLSQDNWREVLQPYIDKGIVEVEDIAYDPKDVWDFYDNVQCAFYNRTLSKIENDVEWSIACDTDEFFVPLKDATLPEMLKRYDDAVSVSFCWRCFGTSGVQKIPDTKTMIEALRYSGHLFDNSIKSIARPRYTVRSYQHLFELWPGYKAVFDHGQLFPYNGAVPTFFPEGARTRTITPETRQFFQHNPVPKHSSKVGVWYHYIRRDRVFFENVKLKRIHMGDLMRGASVKDYIQAVYDEEKREFTRKDQAIQRFVPQLRKRLGLDQKEESENS